MKVSAEYFWNVLIELLLFKKYHYLNKYIRK
jgi:hypothetical protein